MMTANFGFTNIVLVSPMPSQSHSVLAMGVYQDQVLERLAGLSTQLKTDSRGN